jgi:hypothetical protein
MTPKTRALEARKAALAVLKDSTGLAAVPAPIAARVVKYAETLGMVVQDKRDWRAEPPPGAWYTNAGLGVLAQASEVVAAHLRHERDDSCDPDVIALRRLVATWRRWGAVPIERQRRPLLEEAAE